MFDLITISIVLINFGFISALYLEAEKNFLKPKLERNNIVNKGVWFRSKFNDRNIAKSNLGDFIFRANSLDVDNVLQNNFDAFGENVMQDLPFVSSYVDRAKRGTNYIRRRRFRKSLNKNSIEDKSVIIKSKLVSDLKPASLFNDYPYEVAVLLNDNIKEPVNTNEELKNAIKAKMNRNKLNTANNAVKVYRDINEQTENSLAVKENAQNNSINITEANNNVTVPKRSMRHDYESEVIKKIEFTEPINNTDDNLVLTKTDRSIFEKDAKVWLQNAPLPDINKYNVISKMNTGRNKPVTERGLIKVISMLTKTFKKIMKQHNEIKDVQKKLYSVNDDFVKNFDIMTIRFQEFDAKYLSLMKLSESLKSFEAKLNTKEEYFNNKQKEMARNLIEFENQQKKFLAQQTQFYNVQKMMLGQNEKVNIKQNLIAKTQSEISHRQNNFARILKKAKQMYLESLNPGVSTLRSITKANENFANIHKDDLTKITYTTAAPPSTESIKINLFSIPIANRIENQDDEIIKEKDEQPIDDLVYKYYFNNTYIDNFMKTKILSSFITSPQHTDITRNAKNKRNQLATTILLPVSKESLNKLDNGVLKRERRWIHHHSKRKLKRKIRGKENVANLEINDRKKNKPDKNDSVTAEYAMLGETKRVKHNKDDPFMKMATNFCNEIGQNSTEQIMNWCVEKALRRLKFIDIKLISPTPTPLKDKSILQPLGLSVVPQRIQKSTPIGVTAGPSTMPSTQQIATESTKYAPLLTLVTEAMQDGNLFFPDNDELESNLKQFDLTPDTEGNYYYDGSVHTSDIGSTESNGFSDLMPGLDSNSKVDLDPLTFDIQSRRRAYVRRMNEDILKNMNKQKFY